MKVNPKIGYSGQVRLTTKFCGETITEQIYHNSGNNPLFEFIANCLAGRWTIAESQKPYKVKLFKNDARNPSEKDRGNIVAVSDYISMTIAPTIDQDHNAIFHFLIPYTYISGEFNQIRIYSAGAATADNFLANVYLTKQDDSGNIIWDTVKKGDANMVYVLDWYMQAVNYNE